jgi:outer membrane PBP1 activator LpoA protein
VAFIAVMRFPSDSIASTSLRRAASLAFVLLFAAGALSCASTRPATRVRVAPAPIVVVPAPEPPPVAVEGAPIVDVPVVPGEPDQAEPVPAPVIVVPPDASSPPIASLPPPPTTNLIALVLPLEEPAYERAASAVREGFLEAAAVAGKSGDCIVIPHARDGVVAAFALARSKGVRVAVGPLVRDDLRSLATANVPLPWTLALNQLDDATPLPPAIYTFPLSVESDGKLLARRAKAAGAASVDVVEGDSPLMHRLASGFAKSWMQDGGRAPAALRFNASPDALSGLRHSLASQASGAVLLAVNGDHAALVKPFIGNVLSYASGLVFDRPSQAVARDLDGVRVVEIPWLLTPDAPELAPFPRREYDSDALARLYALGLDAYRVAASFTNGPPERFDLDGATGHVHLGAAHEFQREGRLGVYRDGVLVPLDSTP